MEICTQWRGIYPERSCQAMRRCANSSAKFAAEGKNVEEKSGGPDFLIPGRVDGVCPYQVPWFGEGGSLIRARLAVFVAAAIVFAPGPGFGDGSLQRRALDVAARMLAPTFNEPEVAAYNPTTFAKKAQEHVRRHSDAFLALSVLVGAMCFANFRFGRRLGEHPQRGTRRATTRHRDRAPPHLQFV